MDHGFVGDSDTYKACEGQMRSMWAALSHLNASIDLAEITPLHFSCKPFLRAHFFKGKNPEFNGGNLGPFGVTLSDTRQVAPAGCAHRGLLRSQWIYLRFWLLSEAWSLANNKEKAL